MSLIRRIFKWVFIFLGATCFMCSIFTTPSTFISTYDYVLYKLFFLFLSFSFLIPILYYRSIQKKKSSSHFFHFLVLFSFFLGCSFFVSNLHSDEYIAFFKNKGTSSEGENLDYNQSSSYPPSNLTNLKVHYIDVGQGDAIFIELPNQEVMLIDAGIERYGAVVADYIQNLGYSSIQYLIASHPHSDHIGGLSYILEHFSIQQIYMPNVITTTKTYENLLQAIVNQKLKAKVAKSGVSIVQTDSLSIEFLAPNRISYHDINNYSAVLFIRYKNRSFLFMGDAEIESEKEILSSIQADVVKVGHHGSNTSSGENFVNQLHAQYAIVSVGKNNSYEHPSSVVLNRWIQSGAEVLRTDLEGTIIVETDGNYLSIATSNHPTFSTSQTDLSHLSN